MRLELYQRKDDRIWCTITAALTEGKLSVSGHDLGPQVEEFFPGGEYEYVLSLSEESTSRLFETLGCDNDPDEKKLQIIKDNFSLFHELAHIALGHVGQSNGTSEDDEKAADKWAGDTLITCDDFEQFKRKRDYSEKSVLRFAKDQGIASGIVVGRMQMEGMIKHSMLNNLKEKYEIAV